MDVYSCLILDDEPIAREILAHYVSQVPELRLAASLGDPMTAMQLLREQKIDLLLLDIQMPGLSGIQLLESLDQAPAVIFSTAHRKYALEGFELAAIDYLLKPIAFPRFLKAINRFLDSQKLLSPASSPLEKEAPDHIFVRVNRRSLRLNLADILWVEGLKDYIRIYTPKQKLVVKSTLAAFGERLPGADFLRIHRSYIVARRAIEEYDKEEVLIAGQALPLGRTYKQTFLESMQADMN